MYNIMLYVIYTYDYIDENPAINLHNTISCRTREKDILFHRVSHISRSTTSSLFLLTVTTIYDRYYL